VHAVPEGDVVVRLPVDVELVCAREHALVAVRRRVEQQHLVALAHAGAADLDVARRGPVHVLDRRHPAQHLLDGERQQAGVRGELPALVGIPEQRLHAAGDHVARRLVAADEDEQPLLQDVLVGELLAVDLRMDERRHHVVARTGATVGDHSAGVLGVLLERLHDPIHDVGRRRHRQSGDELVGPAQQHVAVLGLDAEEVADHDHRQVRGDVVHEVALAAGRDRVDELVADAADAGLVVLDPARRQPLVHEVPPAPVVGIVEVDHRGDRRRVRSRAHARAEGLRVLRDPQELRVRRDAPDAPDLVPVDRRVLAHPREVPVRVVGVPEPIQESDRGIRGRRRHAPRRLPTC
jgi:hypothetical protein